MPRARSVRRARERPRGNREVEDLGVAEGGREPLDESIVDARMVRGGALGALRGPTLSG